MLSSYEIHCVFLWICVFSPYRKTHLLCCLKCDLHSIQSEYSIFFFLLTYFLTLYSNILKTMKRHNVLNFTSVTTRRCRSLLKLSPRKWKVRCSISATRDLSCNSSIIKRSAIGVSNTDVPCQSRCGTLNNPHCSMAIGPSSEHRSKFAAHHRYWYCLHMKILDEKAQQKGKCL